MIQSKIEIPKIEKLNTRNQILFQRLGDKHKFCKKHHLYTSEYDFNNPEKIRKKNKDDCTRAILIFLEKNPNWIPEKNIIYLERIKLQYLIKLASWKKIPNESSGKDKAKQIVDSINVWLQTHNLL